MAGRQTKGDEIDWHRKWRNKTKHSVEDFGLMVRPGVFSSGVIFIILNYATSY